MGLRMMPPVGELIWPLSRRFARGIGSRMALMLALLAPAAEAGERVSLELVIAVDVSLSVNDAEYLLQMGGIAGAFRDPEVGELIARHRHGVAVLITQWSGVREARVPLPWRVLRGPEDAQAYGDMVAGIGQVGLGNFTAIGHAVDFALETIRANDYSGDERKIDVSGDGRSNVGPDPALLREIAAIENVTVNGLAIRSDDPGLGDYYRDRVIGGPGSFVVEAERFEDFADAFLRKLKRELEPRVAGRASPLAALSP